MNGDNIITIRVAKAGQLLARETYRVRVIGAEYR